LWVLGRPAAARGWTQRFACNPARRAERLLPQVSGFVGCVWIVRALWACCGGACAASSEAHSLVSFAGRSMAALPRAGQAAFAALIFGCLASLVSAALARHQMYLLFWGSLGRQTCRVASLLHRNCFVPVTPQRPGRTRVMAATCGAPVQALFRSTAACFALKHLGFLEVGTSGATGQMHAIRR